MSAAAATCVGQPISWLALERYALAELDGAVAADVRAHLAACAPCRVRVSAERIAHDALVAEMADQHASMHSTAQTARAQAEAWIATAGIQERSALHTTLIALEREILHHFALEEQEVLPLIQRDLTPEEWASVGEHSRATFAPEQLAIALGLILDNTSAERGAVILGAMPPEARAGFEEFGRPAYAAYRAQITDY